MPSNNKCDCFKSRWRNSQNCFLYNVFEKKKMKKSICYASLKTKERKVNATLLRKISRKKPRVMCTRGFNIKTRIADRVTCKYYLPAIGEISCAFWLLRSSSAKLRKITDLTWLNLSFFFFLKFEMSVSTTVRSIFYTNQSSGGQEVFQVNSERRFF